MLNETYFFPGNIPGQIPIEVPETDVMSHADRALKTLQWFYEAAENRGLVFGESYDIFSCGSPKELSIWYLEPILSSTMYNKHMNECSDSRKAGCRNGISTQCDENSKSVISLLDTNGVNTLYLFCRWIEGGFLENYDIDRETMAHLNDIKLWLYNGEFEAMLDSFLGTFQEGGPTVA